MPTEKIIGGVTQLLRHNFDNKLETNSTNIMHEYKVHTL